MRATNKIESMADKKTVDTGYYLPANKDEIREFCNFMEKRAKHSFIAIQSARRALGEIEGQQTFMP